MNAYYGDGLTDSRNSQVPLSQIPIGQSVNTPRVGTAITVATAETRKTTGREGCKSPTAISMRKAR